MDAQDLNSTQYEFINLLKKNNICNILLVGDETGYVKAFNITEYVDYLKLLNTSEYHKGSIEEITNFILTKYKDMQSEDEGYDLEHTWLNGEVLIIKVENGYASAWVQ